jgi:branched-chain amino acid transport system substrate-binding protein
VPIGLLLSYSGSLAAGSINSERAFLMAVEAANAAGGVGGQPVRVLARDTLSDPRRVSGPARELLQAGVQLFVGPDTVELGVELKALLGERTLIMPSFTTADSNIYKPHSWFVMGAPAARVACELRAQLAADQRKQPLVVTDPGGYNNLLAFELTKAQALPRVVLPTLGVRDNADIQPVTATSADAIVLATSPPSASSLLYALGAVGAIGDPHRFYLSPTLHTPALLETLPRGMLVGARGVAPGSVAGSQEFADGFARRWHDVPLDDAHAFYDAGAVAVLALQRAQMKEGKLPEGTGLAAHIVAVTRAANTPVRWNEIDRGLSLLAQGQEVAYVGLSGPLEFDLTGQTPGAYTKWWTVGPGGFEESASTSNCR